MCTSRLRARSTAPRVLGAACAALLAFLPGLASAQSTLYWTGSSTWADAAAWSTSLNGSTSGSVPTSGNIGFFNATTVAAGPTISLGADRSLAGLAFGGTATGTTTLTGGGVNALLTLGSSGLSMSGTAGPAVVIGSTAASQAVAIALGASQSWTNNATTGLTVLGNVSRATGDTTSRVLTLTGSGATTLSGAITDGGSAGSTLSLVKSGTGALTISGATSNSYGGTTTVTTGTVTLAKTGGATALGNELILDNAASPDVYTTVANQFAPATIVSFQTDSGDHGRLELIGTTQTVAGIRTVGYTGLRGVIQNQEFGPANAGTGTLVLNGTGNYFYSGYLRNGNGGTLALTKLGSGTQTLSSTEIRYTGATNVVNGRLVVQNPGANFDSLSMAVASGGILEFNATSDMNLNLQNQTFSGTGTIIKSGGGTLFMAASGNNFYSNLAAGSMLDVQGGRMYSNNFNSWWGGNRSALTIAAGASFDTSNGNTFTFDGIFGSGTMNVSTGVSQVVTVGAANGSGTFTGQWANTSGILGLTKTGTGVQVLAPTTGYGATGAFTVSGGELVLDYANMATATNLVNASSSLTLGGGTLRVLGRLSGSTSQTFNGLALPAGASTLLVNPNGGAATTVAVGAITGTTAGGSTLVGTASGAGSGTVAITTTSATAATGIYTPRIVYTDGTNYDWTTSTSAGSPYTLSGLAAGAYATIATSGSDAANSSVSSSTSLSGALTTNSLKVANPSAGQTLTLASGTTVLTSGGLLATGSNAFTITGGTLTAGNGTGLYELVVQQYSSGTLTIGSAIVNNGANATALTKAGPGVLALTGTSTFTGGIAVTGGSLVLGGAGLLNNGSYAGAIANNGSLVVATSGNQTLGGAISGTGSLSKSGAGTLTLNATTNASFPGGTTIDNGIVHLTGAGAANVLSYSGTVTINNGGILRMGRSDTWGAAATTSSAPIVVNPGGMIQSNGVYNTFVDLVLAGGTLQLNGGLNATWGSYGLRGTVSVTGTTPSRIITVSGGNNLINLGPAPSAGNTTFFVADVTSSTAADLIVASQMQNSSATVNGFTKTGPGTMQLTVASTYTGTTAINAGVVEFDFTNLATPTNMISASSPLALAGGTLRVTGKTSGATAQTVNGLSLQPGGGGLLVNPNGGTSSTVTLGAITGTFAGGAALVGTAPSAGAGTVAITTTTARDATTGIYTPRIVYTNGSTYDWATTASASSPYTLSALASGSYAALAASGSNTSNSLVSSGTTLSGALTTNTLKVADPASGQTLTLASGTTVLSAGGLLLTGSNAFTVTGGALSAGNGAGAYDLVVQQYSSGTLSVDSAIADNGTNAVAFTKAGTGALALTGTSTYTGPTFVNGGSLVLAGAGLLGSGSYAGAIANNGALVISTTATQTLAGAISGTGGLTKSGVGTLTLAGTNTYSGATVINGGTLVLVGSVGTTGTATVNSGAVLRLGANDGFGAIGTTAATQLVVNTGGVVQSNGYFNTLLNPTLAGGTLQLTGGLSSVWGGFGLKGTVSVTGSTASRIEATSGANNAVNVGLAQKFGSTTFAVADVTGNTDADLVVAAVIQNADSNSSSGIAKTGLGTMQLTATNTFTGGLDVSAGVLDVGGAGQLNAGSYAGVITNAGTLRFSTSASQTLSGGIAGSGALSKTGSGRLVLLGTNAYTGATTVDAGTLVVNGLVRASTITVNSGATLGGSGTAAAITLAAGSKIAPGNSPGTLTTGAEIWNGTASYDWEMYDSTAGQGVGWDLVSGTGTLTVNATSGSPFTFNLISLSGTSTPGPAFNWSTTTSGTYRIATFTGGITAPSGTWWNLNTAGFTPTNKRGTFSLAVGSTDISVVYTYTPPPTYDWTAGAGVWSAGSNWSTNPLTPEYDAILVFSGPGGTSTNDLVSGTSAGQLDSVASLTFAPTAGSYTLDGNAFTLDGSGVVNQSAVTQTIQNGITLSSAAPFNAQSGGLAFSGTVNTAAYLLTVTGSGNTTLASTVTGSGGLAKTGAGTLVLTGTTAHTGGTTLTSGSLMVGTGGTAGELAGTVANGAVVAFNRSDAATFAGSMSGTGRLIQMGSGTLSVTGSNSYTGGTVLSAGVLSLGSANAIGTSGTISFTGGTLQYTGSNTTDYSTRFSTAAGQAYSIDTNGRAVTLATALTSSGGTFTKLGSGTVTLGAVNTYTGGSVINGGVVLLTGSLSNTGTITINSGGILRMGNNDRWGNHATAASSPILVNAGGAIQSNGSFNTLWDVTLAGGTMALTGGLNASFPAFGLKGTLTATGNTASQIVAVSGANNEILIGPTTAAGNLVVSVADVTSSTATDLTISVNLRNTYTAGYAPLASGLTKTGAGTLQLGGANSYTNGTIIDAGTVLLVGTLSNTGTITINNGGTLRMGAGDRWGNANTTATAPILVNAGGLIQSNNFYNTFVDLTLAGGTLQSTGGFDANWQAYGLRGTVTVTGSVASRIEPGVGGNGRNAVNIGPAPNAGDTTFAVADVTGSADADLIVASVLKNSRNLAGTADVASGITKTGVGTMQLTAVNTFTGGLTISAGAIELAGAGQLGSTGTYAGAIANSGTFRMATSANQTLTGTISGAGALVKSGAGTLTLTNAANSFSGGTTLDTGTLVFSSGALGSTGTIAMGADTVLRWAAGNSQDVSSRLALPASGGLTFDTGTNAVAFATGLGAGSALALTKAGAGTLTLTASNGYSGATTIAGGTLALSGAGRLASASVVDLPASGVALDISAADGDVTIAGLAGAAGSAIRLGGNTLTATIDSNSTFNGSVSGSGGFTKAGGGTLVLSNPQALSGRVTVSAGELQINAGNALQSAASILVGTAAGSGATFSSNADLTVFNGQTLGGHGTVFAAGAVAFDRGAIVSPGGSVGALAINADVSWSGSSAYVFEITNATTDMPGVDWDLLSVGSLTISATTGDPYRILLTSLTSGTDRTPGAMAPGNWDQGANYAWLFVDAASTIAPIDASWFSFDTTAFLEDHDGDFSVVRGDAIGRSDTDLYIVYAAVPEPTTLALAAAGLAALALARRRGRVRPATD